ncbi:hypothetical protein ACIQXV_24530 [Neobacillus sp. NPDC097160]|uniref:hypothetical protein n=1 Tax=Neobacillus sp. NPDC097160 TaxID=3364298 RepID=UPI0037F69F13
MSVKTKVESFIEEYNQKLQDLQTRLQDAVAQSEYLQFEIKMLNEVEIPQATAKAVLESTDDSHVYKLKKQLSKYQEQYQAKQESVIILQNAIKQYQYQSGEKLVELDRLYSQEKFIQETKHYAKMLYFKKQFIDAMIEEGQHIKELNQLDTKVQEILVQAGRKNGVYTDSTVKSTPTNSGNGNYLALSHTEVIRFIKGNYSDSDYKHVKPYNSLKDLK